MEAAYISAYKVNKESGNSDGEPSLSEKIAHGKKHYEEYSSFGKWFLRNNLGRLYTYILKPLISRFGNEGPAKTAGTPFNNNNESNGGAGQDSGVTHRSSFSSKTSKGSDLGPQETNNQNRQSPYGKP